MSVYSSGSAGASSMFSMTLSTLIVDSLFVSQISFLICAILSKEQIREYLSICEELGLSALVEAHDESEVEMALGSGARIIGVNNRNLKDFTVDTSNSASLRGMIPKDKIFVSESGVKSREDVKKLEEIGVDAVLVGESLMRAEDKKQMLRTLRGI